jgi:hypothetical protein
MLILKWRIACMEGSFKFKNKFGKRGCGGIMEVITPPRKLKKRVSNYNTRECDFNTHKSAFYTQSAIYRM